MSLCLSLTLTQGKENVPVSKLIIVPINACLLLPPTVPYPALCVGVNVYSRVNFTCMHVPRSMHIIPDSSHGKASSKLLKPVSAVVVNDPKPEGNQLIMHEIGTDDIRKCDPGLN